jgi:predicted metalloprotease with PDZ domain
MTVSTGLPDIDNKSAYQRWLNFITHEYFHLYNVKTIRPISLGPFDYSAENYTHMLWVSEGFTVYYEYLIMNRAGLMTRTEMFGYLTENIKNYEDIPASRFQSATQSSFDTWIQFFNFGENSVNTKISYYDKGCALGMLLDLKIRNCSKNAKSLDDVMKFLYFTYYKEKKRGFTDMEFRQVCERMAGCSLSEIFEVYACTTAPVNYPAYLDYAGLLIDTTSTTIPGAYIGLDTRKEGNKTIISQVLWNSPAWQANLSAGDEIVRLNNVPLSNGNFENHLLDILPGKAITLQIIRNGKEKTMGLQTSPKIEKSFRISEKQSLSDFQKQIRESWLK